MKRTSDGGYIVSGSCYYTSTWWYYLLKTDADGNESWSKRYPGAVFDAGFRSVVQTSDDGYVAVGSKSGQMVDVYLVKTDSLGNIMWEKTYGGVGPDYGNALIATADGGFAIAGEYNGGGPTITGLLQKTDALGNSAWQRTYANAKFTGIVQAADNGYVLVGNTYDAGGKNDLLVVKVDSAGNEVRRRTFGGALDDSGGSVARTQDGGYIISGSTSSYSSDTDPILKADIFLIKLNSNLDTVWQRVKGKSTSGDGGNGVVAVSDGGFLVSGALGGAPMLAKFDGDGKTVTLGDTDFTYNPSEGGGGPSRWPMPIRRRGRR